MLYNYYNMFLVCYTDLCLKYFIFLLLSTDVNIPVIQMIVEGGINSLRTVYESVENNLPVLVLEGSGRAADFISAAYHMTENKLE